ncbi:MAG: hypothetical protein AAGG55_05150 [Pseudomonadota bacterium]
MKPSSFAPLLLPCLLSGAVFATQAGVSKQFAAAAVLLLAD